VSADDQPLVFDGANLNQSLLGSKLEFNFDADEDGIDDSIDTQPNKASDTFMHSEGMVGRIIDTGGHKVTITNLKNGKVLVEVADDGDETPAKIELLGVEIEFSPGSIAEADWG